MTARVTLAPGPSPDRAGGSAGRPRIRPGRGLARGCMATDGMRPSRTALALLLVGAAVSLTTVARRRAVNGVARNGGGPGHAHHCFLCEGEWTHRTPCREGRAWLCPWCLTGSREGSGALPEHVVRTLRAIGPARRWRHAHRCPRCLTTWWHRNGGACTAGDRAALPGCPGCRRQLAGPLPER